MDSAPISTGLPAKRPPRRQTPEWAGWVAGVFAVLAAIVVRGAGAASPDLLEAERAFALSAQGQDAQTLSVRYDIADGYYLYRDKFQFSVAQATVSTITLPAGKVKDDPFFGRVEIYRGRVEILLKLDSPRAGSTITLVADSQGCADLGVCYPAQRQTLAVSLPRPGERPSPPVEAASRKKSWFN
jgi:thiol:disulfide interchange protein DsbD